MGAKRLIITGALLLAACGQEPAAPPAAEPPPPAPPEPPAAAAAAAAAEAAIPARIVAERGGFIPEGIEFDTAYRRFLTGSLVDGTIYHISNDGTMAAVVLDPMLVSSVGIEADEPRDRLLVANSDRAAFDGQTPGQAKLGAYSLTTGERLAMVDLGPLAGSEGSYFANDVAVTDDGTAFVTDTMQNVIYRVDPDYSASVFYRFAPMEGLGLNGIVAKDGFLIVVASSANGMLYKIPIDNPDAAAAIMLDAPVTGADGIDWMPDGKLASVSNSASSVSLLESTDDWASARTVAKATFEGQATTGTEVDDQFYVIEPHFNDEDRPEILRVRF